MNKLLHIGLTELLFALFLLCNPAASQGPPAALSDPLSDHFQVTVNGARVPVLHAAMNLYFLNIVSGKKLKITVTAPTENFWVSGVEVQPWTRNIRPHVAGRMLSFTLSGEAKLTISRPNDYLADAEMLYLFANSPERDAPKGPSSNLRYFGPGVRHENIDARSGDNIYLAPGAILFGSLNLWQVDHVHVFGRGVLIYDGPQNPADDDGWQHRPNWHCIVMDHAQEITIEGLTCVVRSRTWQIQMTNSQHILFDGIKVIGANAGNANADGMDWLGGGDTIVRNSFFRAADDVFAMQSGWNGYSDEALAENGQPVSNIVIENTVVSTSISNIVRAAWPRKNFEGGHFEMHNIDVLHSGLGGCGVPFAFFEMWADPDGRGESSDFTFRDIRLEDWYTLFQLRQIAPGIHDVNFTDVMALDQPALVPSVVRGDVTGVRIDDFIADGAPIQQPGDLPMVSEAGAPMPVIVSDPPLVTLRGAEGAVLPRKKVTFEAVSQDERLKGAKYTWLFGDGSSAGKRKVRHRFPDSLGTLNDGSGRFRVLLHVVTAEGRSLWISEPVVVGPLRASHTFVPGITYTYQGDGAQDPLHTGTAATFSLAAVPPMGGQYTLTLEGDIDVPLDGTYSFFAIGNETTTMTLDGDEVATSPAPFPQVCGLAGSAARAVTLSAALAKGGHHLKVREVHTAGVDDFRMLWRGPGFTLRAVP